MKRINKISLCLTITSVPFFICGAIVTPYFFIGAGLTFIPGAVLKIKDYCSPTHKRGPTRLVLGESSSEGTPQNHIQGKVAPEPEPTVEVQIGMTTAYDNFTAPQLPDSRHVRFESYVDMPTARNMNPRQ